MPKMSAAGFIHQAKRCQPCVGVQPEDGKQRLLQLADGKSPKIAAFLLQTHPMKIAHSIFVAIHCLMAALFTLCALALLWIAGSKGWEALQNGLTPDEMFKVVEAIGVLAASVVALQIAQTILEEEVVRDTHISGPTRVRRFLSRFLVVLVVALAVEALITTFKAAEDHELMVYASMLIAAVGTLLAGWGVFIHLNTSAEQLEPEAMEDAKSEDTKVQEQK